MLPVKVSTPTVLPSERAAPAAASQSPAEPKQASRLIEIRLATVTALWCMGVWIPKRSRVSSIFWCSDDCTAGEGEGVARCGRDRHAQRLYRTGGLVQTQLASIRSADISSCFAGGAAIG